MDYFSRAKELHKEAEDIIYKEGIDSILKKYGQVNYTGSYKFNLMAWEDIDMNMVMNGEEFSLDNFFKMGSELAKIKNIKLMKFQDFVNHPKQGLPKGLYWGIRYDSKITDKTWKIDLWIVDKEGLEINKNYISKVIKNLNEENRNLILNVKNSIIDEEGRTPFTSGYYIYEAILFKGLKATDQIINYLKDKGVKL